MPLSNKLLVTMLCILIPTSLSLNHTPENRKYKEKAREMFEHAYYGYMEHAYPEDELKPLSCRGHSTWGNVSLTLIDSLDSLVVLGMHEEYEEGVNKILQNTNFSINKNVSVFETNIRVVGGLLSAHLLMERGGMELPEGWPCAGPLLDLAVDIASRLLPAFNTPTGLPYGTTNLMYGVPKGETTVTGTAGCGTYLMEFGMLSRLTGDPAFEHAARRALNVLFNARSKINLVGNHIDISRGEWIFREAGIGGNVDSYYEYLLKGGLFFEDFELLSQFKVLYNAVLKNLQHDFWYIWGSMFNGNPTLPSVSTLDAFWPSLQILIGDIKSAARTLSNFYSLISHFGFTPEMFSLLTGKVAPGSEIYPLRPEFVESLVYMYQATGDQMWRNMGKQVLDSIELSTKTPCGYATVSNVVTHQLEDKMESFFLSETTKYLYLLFSDDHWIFDKGVSGKISVTPDEEGRGYKVCAPNSFGYTFTTEAHPFPAGVLGCCYPRQKVKENLLEKIYQNSSDEPLTDGIFGLPNSILKLMYGEAKLKPGEDPPRDLCSPVQRFLVKTVRAKKESLFWDEPSPAGDVRTHNCPVRPWYAKYEIYGIEWSKLSSKKAFRVVNKNSKK